MFTLLLPSTSPPALDRNDKRPGTKVWPRPIEIYQIWAYPSSRTVALRKNICWQTGLSTIFFPESYSSAAKPTQLFFPCTLLQRYGKKSRFITRFRLLYKDVLICIVVLCINHSILCFLNNYKCGWYLKFLKQDAHGPHRSREKQSLAINKIEQRYDSSTLLKKIKESLSEFWRMVFHLYTPGLCIVKLKLVLKF